MLPKDATPDQQDSAIQAWFQPAEIHYSSQPDTLHLPGHDVGRNLKDVNLPQYYRETFFARDTLLHPELAGGRLGMAGDPVPYMVRNDNTITGLLLFCLVLTLFSFAQSKEFILRQLKNFFYIPRTENPNAKDPSNRFQIFLNIQTCLLLAIATYFYIIHYIAGVFIIDSPFELIGIFSGLFFVYFLCRIWVYRMVNTVFFDGKKSKHWTWTIIFITALEGVALFPVVMTQVFFDLPMQSVVYYFIFVLVLTKLLTFYKCWLIFFRQIGFFLQIILYLCALEIVPLLSLGGILVLITDCLKVNY